MWNRLHRAELRELKDTEEGLFVVVFTVSLKGTLLNNLKSINAELEKLAKRW